MRKQNQTGRDAPANPAAPANAAGIPGQARHGRKLDERARRDAARARRKDERARRHGEPGRGNGEPDREERTRQRIVDYAERVFSERGFRRITVEDLCVGMALSKRTFYKYFRNRDELVEAVVDAFVARVMRRIVPNLQSVEPVREVLANHFQLLYEDLLSVVSLTFMSDVQSLTPALWRKIEERRAMVVGLVVNVVERGQKEGVIRADLDATVFGKVFERMVTTVAEPSFLLAANITMQSTLDIMRGILTRGIIVPEKAKEARHGR